MMGSGKSTIGPLVAERLFLPWVDLDRLIERGAGCSIAEIWNTGGEEAFRALEVAAVEALDPSGSVVGCGGGIVTRESNRSRLLRMGRCVYLRASPEGLASRLWGSGSATKGDRPLLAGIDSESDLVARIGGMLSEREDLYESCAELVVDTESRTPEESADLIAEWWERG